MQNSKNHQEMSDWIILSLEAGMDISRTILELLYPKAEVNQVVWALIEAGKIQYADENWDRLLLCVPEKTT